MVLGRNEPSIDGPSHHGSGAASTGGHDILDDWTECWDEFLEWCLSLSEPRSLNEPSPVLGPKPTASPQSPTAVDRFHCATKREPAFKFDLEAVVDDAENNSEEYDETLEFVMVKPDRYKDAGKDRDDWLGEDSVSWDSTYKEKQRRRQRSYERSYKKRKQENLASTRREWLELELVLHQCLQKRSHALTVSQSATCQERILEKLLEARGLERDTMLLMTTRFWKKLFALRNYTITEEEIVHGIPEDDEDGKEQVFPMKAANEHEIVGASGRREYEEVTGKIPEEILRSEERWAAIDHKILGASTVTPFQPLRFEFQW